LSSTTASAALDPDLLERSFAGVAQRGSEFARLFYEKLFTNHAELRP
jgi:hypothetical protein